MRLSRFVEFGRKIICVGRNYRDHAAELGNEVPEKPLLFMKPPTAYVVEGNPIKIPRACDELHHEVELGVIISRKAKDVDVRSAMDFVGGYALCLDMTARKLQNDAKARGHPWEIAKGFDTSCPVGSFIPKENVPEPHELSLWCRVNGQLRQEGRTSDMIFNIPTIISYISGFFTLEPGDLILTGTPAGVGPIRSGDVIEAGLEGHSKMKFSVEQQK
ncbi:acylpyruvase FAHD1, mitochondrial-like [Ornithodoros turicata]|uniref:Oxaloacetate tautomerase FAHD1, mitochondrial n=1 Tax=Ornithodoros turicata TaxID=34597 RepID=A0A2R5L5G6_9ACAR